MPSERALLISVQLEARFAPAGTSMWSLEDEAMELAELVKSAGCRIVGELKVKRHRPIAGTFLGIGKLNEIAQAADELQAHVAIFNHELSSAQQRNIEEMLRVKTIDRTQLILDIFAQRAKSQEGKIQVELAQLRYLLPRLAGKGIMLSRLGGGIGTRGPGEQKLEMDRRRIRSRITRLGQELVKLSRRRLATRARRHEAEIPVAAIVGYTNAGKTTLLNRLSGGDGIVRDQLFTTLDPLARRLQVRAFASGAADDEDKADHSLNHAQRKEIIGAQTLVLTDTVGFLHQLPHHLIEAFKATLEEAHDADLLLHVVDASSPMVFEQAKAVEEVLRSLSLQDKPTVTVLNKRDLIPDEKRLAALELAYEPAIAVSAITGEGIDKLLEVISSQLGLLLIPPIHLRLPSDRQDLIARVYQAGHVLRRIELDGAVELIARFPGKLKALLEPYILS